MNSPTASPLRAPFAPSPIHPLSSVQQTLLLELQNFESHPFVPNPVLLDPMATGQVFNTFHEPARDVHIHLPLQITSSALIYKNGHNSNHSAGNKRPLIFSNASLPQKRRLNLQCYIIHRKTFDAMFDDFLFGEALVESSLAIFSSYCVPFFCDEDPLISTPADLLCEICHLSASHNIRLFICDSCGMCVHPTCLRIPVAAMVIDSAVPSWQCQLCLSETKSSNSTPFPPRALTSITGCIRSTLSTLPNPAQFVPPTFTAHESDLLSTQTPSEQHTIGQAEIGSLGAGARAGDGPSLDENSSACLHKHFTRYSLQRHSTPKRALSTHPPESHSSRIHADHAIASPSLTCCNRYDDSPITLDVNDRDLFNLDAISNDDSDDASIDIAMRNDFISEFESLYPYTETTESNYNMNQEIVESHFPFTHSPLTLNAEGTFMTPLDATKAFKLQGAYAIDGGCLNKSGSAAFTCYYQDTNKLRCDVVAFKLSMNTSTNNQAELSALLQALKHACSKKLRRVMIITDSSLVRNFILGRSRISQEQLYALSLEILQLMPSFDAIYASKVRSHQADTVTENAVADALCSWSILHNCSVSHSATMTQVSYANERLNILPLVLQKKASETNASRPLPPHGCKLCGQRSHNILSCPLSQFANLKIPRQSPCLCCLSPFHITEHCPLVTNARQFPLPSSLIPEPVQPLSDVERKRADHLFRTDIESLKFPNNCSRRQFLDYWDTVFIALNQAETPLQEATAAKAARAWSSAYHFEKHLIKRSKPRKVFPATVDTGDNRNPTLHNAQDDLAKRALRAARLVPHARVSDVAKALRTAAPIALTDDVLHQIQQCYPSASAEEKTTFEPRPLTGFTVDRDALARVIMSRAPKSHPGASGITFDVLQHFCLWSYKLEDEHNPDPRWDRFCRLISKIMSGNATALSLFLLDVIGAVFNKNAEKLDGSFALRNLGIEESLLRIAATLVFERVLPPAMAKGFLSHFDLGAGRKAGAKTSWRQ
jgi:ribonuclease HI